MKKKKKIKYKKLTWTRRIHENVCQNQRSDQNYKNHLHEGCGLVVVRFQHLRLDKGAGNLGFLRFGGLWLFGRSQVFIQRVTGTRATIVAFQNVFHGMSFEKKLEILYFSSDIQFFP